MGSSQIRLGIIGVNRRWQRRYEPALLALPHRFAVAAVCDPSWDRAEPVAKAFGAEMAAGPAALFERDDLDAVLFIAGSWQKLWPLELAARRGRPTLCRFFGPELLADAAVVEQARQSGTRFLADLPARFAPATARLRELLDGPLGPPRILLADTLTVGPAGKALPLDLLDWCTAIFGELPERVLASPNLGDHFAAIVPQWSGERMAALRRYRTPAKPGITIRVVAERGLAHVTLPNRISWSVGGVRHEQRLRGGPPAIAVLEAFHDLVTSGAKGHPDLNDIARLLALVAPGSPTR